MKNKSLPMGLRRKTLWLNASLILASLLFTLSNVRAQNPVIKVFEDWQDTAGTQNTFYKAVVRTVPGTTYTVVAGATLNSNGNYDILVEQLDGSGSVVWVQQYDGPGHGNDIATDLQLDPGGNVFVTGTYYQDATDSNNVITIAYDYNGSLAWLNTYNGNGSANDGGAVVCYDAVNRETYVAGTEWDGTANKYDWVALKYDTYGNQLWVNTLDYNTGNDIATRMYFGSKGLYVGGSIESTTTTYDYAVTTIGTSNGIFSTPTVISGNSPFGIDKLAGIVSDKSGNVYVSGTVVNISTLTDLRTIKLDSNMNLLWTQDFDYGYSMNDIATGIALDSLNNVIVAGTISTAGNGMDYEIIKYDSLGNLRWLRNFNGAANGDDSATAIVVSPTDTNKIYITGYSFNGSTKDYWTMRFDGAGNEIWDIGFNSIPNGNDMATAIAIDTLGGIVVTGQNQVADTIYGYTTVKYIEHKTYYPQDTIAATSSSFVFTENRGQLLNTNGDSIPQIKYYTIHGSPNVYFSDTAVSYVFAKLDTSSSHQDSLTRVDMKYFNANPGIKIRSTDVRSDYENFFLAHIPEGRSNVHNYDKLFSFSVWNNVDVMYGNNSAGLKTYFICKPGGGGGSYANIDLKYAGADSMKIGAGGQLTIYTKLGNIMQPKAAAWELDGSGNFTSLGWQPTYHLTNGNEIAFTSIGSYNTAHVLVIAVDWGYHAQQNISNLTWSTYYGAGGNNLRGTFNDIKVMNNGEILTCGQSNAYQFPLSTPHVYGPVISGGLDATVVKFFANGKRDWATYYGGTVDQASANYSPDDAYGIDVDSVGDVLFTGATNSTDFPLHHWGTAYYDSTNTCTGGGCTNDDVFIVQLDSNGMNPPSKWWSTYYGGTGADAGSKLRVSSVHDDIYIVGIGGSNFPLDSSLAYWNSHYGTGMILRFDAAGHRKWATKIGSSASTVSGENTISLVIDKLGDIAITGLVTGSSGFPVLHNLCTDSSNIIYQGGSGDAYITKFSGETNDLLWSTYYGSQNRDYSWDIKADSSLNYYITGYTQGGTNLHRVNPGGGAYYQSSFGGGVSDAYLAEFDDNGCLIWSTYYGGSAFDEGKGLTLDSANNIFLLGLSSSINMPFPVSNLGSAYVVSTNSFGDQDAFVNCFQEGTHQQIWTTYFGGNGSEFPAAAAAYNESTLYIVGQTLSSAGTNFPLDNGGGPPVWYQDTVGSSTAWITRFDINPAIVGIPEQFNPEQLALTMYPNPSQGAVWIQGDIDTKKEITIEVFDLLGQKTYSETLPAQDHLQKEILLSNYADGIYLVHITTSNKIFTGKIIIQQ